MTSIHENERDGDDEMWEEVDEWVSPMEGFLDRLAINNDALQHALRPPFQDQLDALQRVADLARPISSQIPSIHEQLSGFTPASQGIPDFERFLNATHDPGGVLWQNERLQRQNDQTMTALGYIKVRRRRYARHAPSQSRTPLVPGSPPLTQPPVNEPCGTDRVTVTPPKRGRGRLPGHRVITAQHFDILMCAYCTEKSATPSRREFQIFAAKKHRMVDVRRLSQYAHDYCDGKDWPGVRRLYGQRFGVQ